MIVRIFSDGQYELDDAALGQLQEVERRVEAAISAGEDSAFRAAYAELLALVHDEGTPLADDDLRPSQLMLPPADTSLEEARSELAAQDLTLG